jgi:hypothetical protein
MSRSIKIALIVLGGIVLLCICSLAGLRLLGTQVFDRVVVDNPAESAAVAQSVLDYRLPSGYQEQMTLDFFAGKMVMIASDSPGTGGGMRPIIMMMQMPIEDNLDPSQLRQQMEQGFQQAGQGQAMQFNLVKTKRETLRGQSVNLYTFEGVDGTGQYFRQLMTDPFEGKSGSVIVSVFGPIPSWDKRSVDYFIDSIR